MNDSNDKIITIAKRDNNTKRSYLLVNPLQGKHIPVAPQQTLDIINLLANKVFSEYQTEHLLIIGFAETATAIGTILASFAPFNINYLHTTREVIKNVDYLFFSEEHSHATEQKLIKNSLDRYLCHGIRIIFAEDEVTTGKTIENIIAVLNKTYPQLELKFGIASILNGMSLMKIEELKAKDIHCQFLLSVPNYDYETILSNYHYQENLKYCCHRDLPYLFNEVMIDDFMDTRIGVSINSYIEQCNKLSLKIVDQLKLSALTNQKILIVGTEECMYPGLYFGNYLERNTMNNQIRFHATTRSPILPCNHPDYPLKKRYELVSFYDDSRTTYIYNLDTYDYVFVLTDTTATTAGMNTLCDALSQNHCGPVTKIIWRTR